MPSKLKKPAGAAKKVAKATKSKAKKAAKPKSPKRTREFTSRGQVVYHKNKGICTHRYAVTPTSVPAP